ncbi:hypothetical protein GOODEAATRI_027597 [Goodea atripinnis]|uniref:Uncharacterized protein n=1 Tax=Goodea atripinnis TaxID=208336 RepID=A0ABV0MVN9_9TELE
MFDTPANLKLHSSIEGQINTNHDAPSTVPLRKHLRWDLLIMPVMLEAIRIFMVKYFLLRELNVLPPCLVLLCKVQTGHLVALKETWPLKMFKDVFEALPSQMLSDDYWAVSTSKGLNLGQGSTRVLKDTVEVGKFYWPSVNSYITPHLSSTLFI